MIGAIIALGSALAIAVSAIISKSLTAKIAALPLQTLRCWVGSAFLMVVLLLLGRTAQLTHISLPVMGLIIVSAIIGIALGDTLYLRTLSQAEASRVFPVVRSSQILSATLIATSFLGEQITLGIPAGAILIIGGVYLGVYTKSDAKQEPGAEQTVKTKWIPMAVMVGISWGVSWSIMKVVLEDVDPLVANSFKLPLVAVALTVLVLTSGQGKSLKVAKHGRATLGLIIASGILSYGIGAVLALYAIQLTGVSRTAILTASAPIFVLFLSILFLKERFTPRLGLGTVMCAGGIALVVIL